MEKYIRPPEDRYLTRKEAAAHCQAKGAPVAASTLAKLFTLGGGPLVRHFGRRVLYRPEDLDAWLAARVSSPRRSSSERARRTSAMTEVCHERG